MQASNLFTHLRDMRSTDFEEFLSYATAAAA